MVSFIGLLVYSYNPLFNIFFEAFLLLLVFLSLGRVTIKTKIVEIFIVNIAYIVVSLIYAIFFYQDNIKDFLLIYKIFIYLFILTFLIDKTFLSIKRFNLFFKYIVILFFAKYLLSILIFGDRRPTLFYENNFELMLLSLLFYLYFIINGKVKFIYQLLISLTFLLSASISGILILLFILPIINYKLIVEKIVYILPVCILLVIGIVGVLFKRMGGEIDFTTNVRYKFLMRFLDETKNWSFYRYFIGAERISALSEATCRNLGYWKTLFSYKKDGTCYSVILHSYLLRVIYDHGIIGFLFIISYIVKIFTSAGYSIKNASVILGVVLINGLSVSSFNSIYFIIGIVFFLIIEKNNKLLIES